MQNSAHNFHNSTTFTALAQQIILSKDATVLDYGNNAIFNNSHGQKQHLFPLFFESVFQQLLDLELGDADIFFPKVIAEKNEKKVYFDFYFSKMIYQNEIAILWTIAYSPDIEQVIRNQQAKNEKILESRD